MSLLERQHDRLGVLCDQHRCVLLSPLPSSLPPPQVNKLVRCLSLLKEYVLECDEEYSEERGIPPHGK